MRLRRLSLVGTAITDDSAAELAKLTQLEALNVKQTRMTNRGFEALLRLPRMEQLSFDFQLSNVELNKIGNLGRLNCTDLVCRGVDAASIGHLNDTVWSTGASIELHDQYHRRMVRGFIALPSGTLAQLHFESQLVDSPSKKKTSASILLTTRLHLTSSLKNSQQSRGWR